MSGIKAGKLRHQVVVERKARTQDPNTGEITYEWVEFRKLWASVEPLSAREFIAAQATQSKVTARIVARFRDDIDPTMRIRFRGKFYNIEGVLPDMRSGIEHITMPVSEGVTDGS